MKRILIVEDSNDLRDLLRTWLEAFGYQVVEATDGYEAIECVQWASPDVVLMDICLPRMDGMAAVQQIRKLNQGRDIPVICVTGYEDMFHKEALQAGCNEVVSKPFEYKNLKNLLVKYLPALFLFVALRYQENMFDIF